MKKLYMILLGLTGLSGMLYAQKENNIWAFGDKAGLDFSSGTAVPIKTALIAGEGSAAVCSRANGNLLFYSNGESVWNKNNTEMPNGKGLKGNSIMDKTTAQGVCIIPVIDAPGKYYLFSLEPQAAEPFKYSNGYLYYSIVDTALNGGLGDVVANKKNIVLDSFLSEAMITVPGNNCDIWLLVHPIDTAIVKAYHITKDGIDPKPVISTTGINSINGGGSYGNALYAISPDRSKLAVVSSNLAPYAGLSSFLPPGTNPNGALVCNFDPNTGMVSNTIVLNSNVLNPNDQILNNYICFSPNSQKLYLAASNRAPGDIDFLDSLWQYDVTNMNTTAVLNSKVFIHTSLFTNSIHIMQYKGDKMYVLTPDNISFTTPTVDVIQAPNATGTACNYQQAAINLLPGTAAIFSLPNMVVYAPERDTIHSKIMDTLVCSGWDKGVVLPSPAGTGYTYLWDNQTTDEKRTINTSGTYWVRSTNGCHTRFDTFTLAGSDIDAIINVNVSELGTIAPYKTYQWYVNDTLISGATNSTYTPTRNGNYTVFVTNEAGCSDTSEIYAVGNMNSISKVHPLAHLINVYPNPAQNVLYINTPAGISFTLLGMEGKILRQSTNTSSISLQGLAEGIYLLRVTDKDGTLIKVEKIVKTK